jgi:hypothetical protein
MNMHEFQNRLRSNGDGDPILSLVRKLQRVRIAGARRVLSEQTGGWIVWNEPTQPTEPGDPGFRLATA